MPRLSNSVILLVGGGADGPPAEGETLAIGNGRATAIVCAREGAKVMVADRDLGSAEETAKAIREEGGVAEAVSCDVLDDEQSRAAVEATVAAFGSLTGLVNNVGGTDIGPITETTPATFESLMRLNVQAHFVTMQLAIPEMVKAGKGSIVNVSSINAIRAGAAVAYEATKAALLGLSRNAAMTEGPKNIRVNAILPGVINSTMLRRFVGDGHVDFTARIPLGRHGTPWEVGSAVAFLLSDDASFITGHELVVDGGMTTLM